MNHSLYSREEWPELNPPEVDYTRCRDCRNADPTGPNNHVCDGLPNEKESNDGDN